MAKKNRAGNRKLREQRKQFKVPELGYYLIVTDTEATKRCFFTGLHQELPEDVRNKLVIKVVETKTGQKYSKVDEQMYEKLCKAGDEEKAIQIVQQKLEQSKREGKTKSSEMCPCTTLQELVGEIKGKCKKNVN